LSVGARSIHLLSYCIRSLRAKFRLFSSAFFGALCLAVFFTEIELVLTRLAGTIVYGDGHFAVFGRLGERERVVTVLDRQFFKVVNILDRLSRLRVDRIGIASLRVHLPRLTRNRICARCLVPREVYTGTTTDGHSAASAGADTSTAAGTYASTGPYASACTDTTAYAFGITQTVLAATGISKRVRLEPLTEQLHRLHVSCVDSGNKFRRVTVDRGGFLLVIRAELTELGLHLGE